MNETEFVKGYVASFLGAWAANVTQEARQGWQSLIVNQPPIEDAIFQAKETFKQGLEIDPKFFIETGYGNQSTT